MENVREEPDSPTFPTIVVRLSFVEGETEDRSFSNLLLSLEITATLKPLHKQTHTQRERVCVFHHCIRAIA